MMLNCFGPVRSGENIIGSVRGRGHKIYYFSVRSGSGQKLTGHFGVGVSKTLPRRTLIATMYFIVTLNDRKASSFNRNMCGMKTKNKTKTNAKKKICVKIVSHVLGHSYNAAWIQILEELGWDIKSQLA